MSDEVGSGIFLSYRRDDAAGHAGRLFDALIARFGRAQVFMDVDSIELGVDFLSATSAAIEKSTAVLAIVGPAWLDARDESGERRLDDPNDYVRRELELAFEHGVRVVPVLMRGASVPAEAGLPPSLALLSRCNALEMSDRLWNESVRVLVQSLAEWCGIAYAHTGDSVEAAPPSLPMPLASTTALAGRDAELATLQSQWIRASEPSVAQRRDVVMVTGEPGMGKTRLVGELAASVASAGGHVHYGRCDEDSAAPFSPWIAPLSALVAETPTHVLEGLRDDAAELQRLCPQIAERLDLPPAQVADLDRERARLFSAIERVLIAASEVSPTLIVLDDLHSADRSSLLLLRQLASNDGRGRFLIVGTYRDTDLERTHPLSATLAELRRERRLQRVILRGLDRDATAALIEVRSGHAPDAELVAAVFEETEGHPFFVEEVCTHLIETGGARVSGAHLVAAEDLSRIGIPEGVRDVLGHRFERLAPDAIEALRVAAVMGRVFDLGVLEALLPTQESVLEDVEEALHAGLVREREDEFGAYEFSHALVRSALIDEITTVRRVRLHRRIANAIEDARPRPSAADLDLLAHHYAQAAADGDIAKAVEYARRACEQATQRSAFDEANAYLERGLEIVALARGDDVDAAHAELLIEQARLLKATSAPSSANNLAMQAVRKARDAGSPIVFARAVRMRATTASGSLDQEVMTLIPEALDWLARADLALDVQLRSMAIFHRGFAGELLPGDDATSADLVAEARAIGDWRGLADAFFARATVLRGRLQLEEQRRNANDLLRILSEHNDLFYTGAAYQDLAVTDLAEADRAAFEWDLSEMTRIGECFANNEMVGAWARAGTTALLLMDGRFVEAETALEQFREDCPTYFDVYSAQRFWLRAEQGRLEELRDELAGFEELADVYTVVLPMLAFARARLGDEDSARDVVQRAAADDFAKLGRDWGWPVSLALLAEAVVTIGDSQFVPALRTELAPYRGQLLVLSESVACIGAADRYVAMLDTAVGRIDDAVEGFKAAAALEEKVSAPTLVARTHYWHATAVLARDDTRIDAARLLDEALDAAAALGMVDLARRAESLRNR